MGVWSLDEVIALFDVESVAEGHYRAASLPPRIRPEDEERAVVEGSQILGQALVAASRSQGNRFVKSAHMIFAQPARIDAPVEFLIAPLHAGRSFSSLSVTVVQEDRKCAQALLLLGTDTPDCIQHAAPMPQVARPEESSVYDMPLEGRELRFVEGLDFGEPDSVGPPALDVWVRYEGAPEDPALRQALLAELCGPFTIGASMRPHPGYGQSQAHRTLSTGVLSLTIHFHEVCALDDWLLYSHESVHAGRGLCDGKGRIFEHDGRLVASFAQEGLLRPLPAERVSSGDGRSVF
jgi:acyl-CoA thioesterase-2